MPSGTADFTELKQLGQGVSGICRLARRNADQRLYALKELDMPTEQGEANAVLQEVHILASLEHPFIVRYYDSFLETRKLFLVMEYAPNGSLHTALTEHQRTKRPLAEDTLWRYMLQLLLGLHAIHTHNIIHRDIKPHNIFLSADDSVKIGDFGVSRMLSGSADLATTLVGSPGYLAPELCSGEPYNEKADIWALGVTLIELCALKHPFGGAASQAALVMKIMGHTAPPPLPQGFSQQLSRVLATCMARHSAHRPSALQLLSVPLVYQKAKEHNLHSLVPPQAKRTAPMRKSWHALNYPNAAGSTTSSLGDATCGPGEVHRVSSYDSVGVPARTSSEPPQHGHHPGGHQPPYGHHHHGGRGPEPAEVQRTRSHEPLGEGGMGSPQRAAPHPAAGKGGGAPQRGSSHLRSASEGIAAIQADAHATPHTPPSATTLWAKRRGPDASPGSQTDLNLQLISIKGNDQWQDLQSPLDVFARKHCPSRSRPGCSSSEHHGPSALGRPSGLLCETDEEGHDPTSPSWDRPNNHSPLAALLRREFPSGKPQSERRLFDDL